MLESATVTLGYKEFKSLVDKSERLRRNEKLIEDFIKEREDKKAVKALDNILDLLIEASECKTSKDKQGFILNCIEIYSTTFDIPLEELIKL
ncbi:hypothetical protein KPL28_02690 [Clostridium algidicarnis]|uniref:hypothetical protein n=1 Tax=Clostridium algidicarnis TaxID=37659 RepID=UPI001C0E1B3E|nr:hypothetical protein [Clostridium algidicarnis]MBU3208541.1 hypothetical protein [Clostridium algidicarnis]